MTFRHSYVHLAFNLLAIVTLNALWIYIAIDGIRQMPQFGSIGIIVVAAVVAFPVVSATYVFLFKAARQMQIENMTIVARTAAGVKIMGPLNMVTSVRRTRVWWNSSGFTVLLTFESIRKSVWLSEKIGDFRTLVSSIRENSPGCRIDEEFLSA
jgi:hypothetical protein